MYACSTSDGAGSCSSGAYAGSSLYCDPSVDGASTSYLVVGDVRSVYCQEDHILGLRGCAIVSAAQNTAASFHEYRQPREIGSMNIKFQPLLLGKYQDAAMAICRQAVKLLLMCACHIRVADAVDTLDPPDYGSTTPACWP